MEDPGEGAPQDSASSPWPASSSCCIQRVGRQCCGPSGIWERRSGGGRREVILDARISEETGSKIIDYFWKCCLCLLKCFLKLLYPNSSSALSLLLAAFLGHSQCRSSSGCKMHTWNLCTTVLFLELLPQSQITFV